MSKYFIKKLIRAFLCLWCCIICFIPSVRAEEDYCPNSVKYSSSILKNNNYSYWNYSNNSWSSIGYYADITSLDSLFNVNINYENLDSNARIYIKLPDANISSLFKNDQNVGIAFHIEHNSNIRYISKKGTPKLYMEDDYFYINISSFLTNISLSFTPSEKVITHISLALPTVYKDYFNNIYVSDVPFNDICVAPEQPPVIEPEEPDKPIITDSDEFSILNNFFQLFIDRIKYISNFAINSPIFLCFISVFVLIIILEFILYLFNKGGYK